MYKQQDNICAECSNLRRENLLLKAKLKNISISDEEIIIPLSEIKLSGYTYNALLRAGINTVNDLIKTTTESLLRIRNFGTVSVSEVARQLSKFGFENI